MARQLSVPDLDALISESHTDAGGIQGAIQGRVDHIDMATLLSPDGELRHWLDQQDRANDSQSAIASLFENPARQHQDHSEPPDWIDDLPSPATLQGIVTENVLDLIHDIRDALPDQIQDWQNWIHNPTNFAAVKAIVVEHVQDLVHDVRETLPEELRDWSGWSELGNGLPGLGAIRDSVGDIGHALQGADPSHLQQWSDVAHSTFETIKDAAEDQFGDLGSLSGMLGHGGHAQDIFEGFFDFRPDSALALDL